MKARKYLLLLVSLFFPLMTDAYDVESLKKKVDPYVAKAKTHPDWLWSRLQMYWTTHATDVYVNGERFDHVGGKRAEYPTVKFNGSRSTETQYNLPELENVVPYDDDEQGSVTYVNAKTGRKEKTNPAKTGGNIAGLNRRILGVARDAARLYKATGEKRYADLALPVFDTFLKGIYSRNVPIDMNRGQQQTLLGMTTFEVIHEDAISDVTEIYALLNDVIRKNRDIYDAALKKWAENEIANGVPHNNWNLFQAEFIAKIAFVLQSDKNYADHRGREYYLDYIMNRSSIRQWSLKRLADFGFCRQSHTWYESPGYSVTVLGDFCEFGNTLDRHGINLFEKIPEIERAVLTSPEYLFPNRMIAGFGDTHPNYLSTKPAEQILQYAARHDNQVLTARFDSLRMAILPDAPDALAERWVLPTFYAPNVSWLVQRTGMNRRHDLMVSLNGSLGNHQHANGISMELYGKGYVLGPDAGIGKHLYSGLDYSEYYSQFPAHNTVCVDGISSYPVMMSNHAFKVEEMVPSCSYEAKPFPGKTHSVVSFFEPEAGAEQQRTNGIVKTSESGGYYVDIFRSRKTAGGDKTHDYFYHNLGQTMEVTDAQGNVLPMHPTDELAFAGGHLYAYSYIYDKLCTEMTGDVKVVFKVTPDPSRGVENGLKAPVCMTMWMRGDSARKIVKALSPANLEYERMPNQPYDIANQPVLTFVARQRGEAWTHPFVCIYEPTTDQEPSEIASVSYFTPASKDPSAVGIMVRRKSGLTDYIFSSADGSEMSYQGMTVKGRYQVITK